MCRLTLVLSTLLLLLIPVYIFVQMLRLAKSLKALRTLRLEACSGAEEVVSEMRAYCPLIRIIQPRSPGGAPFENTNTSCVGRW